MCGICGYVGLDLGDVLGPMCKAMSHRGPDDHGEWIDRERRVGLGHQRLSIIDLSAAGHQPMCNEDETVWLSYNGEIYNFPSLREDLLARGHTFRSRTDSEVLVHLYEEKGPEMLAELNGIFALAIWDANTRQMLLARDHAGVKPLYYYPTGDGLVFASEIKALLRTPNVPRRLYREGIRQYLTLLWVPGENTMLADIKKLEPGHYLLWKDGRTTDRRWFNLEYHPDESVGEDEWIEQVHDTFMRTTRRQMVSDVPLGAYLSGGADSSSIVACMRKSFPDREIKCYTSHFAESRRDQLIDDLPYARRVAEMLGVELKTFLLKPDVLSLLGRMIYHLDEPDADPAMFPSYLIARRAREDGTTVLLSGAGGDEVFFGYRSHQSYRLYNRLSPFRSPLGVLFKLASNGADYLLGPQSARARRMRKFYRALVQTGLGRHMALVDWSTPAVRRSLLDRDFAAEMGGEKIPPSLRRYYEEFAGTGNINRHSHVLIQSYLAAHNFLYTDKTSMATAVETRVPFMDVELMKLAARIPERLKLNGWTTKYVLKKSMERYLSPDILYRKKTGFGVPLRKWIAEDLDPLIGDLLSPAQVKKRGLFDPQAVENIVVENRRNHADHAFLIFALLVLELWQQTYIDRPGEMVLS